MIAGEGREGIMVIRRLGAFLIVLVCAAGLAARQAAPRATLLVLSKGDQMLSVVDPSTFKVIGRAPSGPDPHEVIASADGTMAYISNYGGGSGYHTLTPVDLTTIQTQPAIDLGPLAGPHGLTFVGARVWFTAEGARTIGSYDPASRRVDWTFVTGQDRTHMIWVATDESRIITTNVNSATVSVIERAAGRGRGPAAPAAAASEWTQTVIPVGRGAEGFDVAPNGSEVWTANAQDGTISVIDLTAKRVSQTIPANISGANRLKFSPDGKLVLVSMLNNAEVAVFDTGSRKERKRIRVGTGAEGVQMQPDGARAFVSCTPDNYVAVIDLATLAVVGRIEAGKQPDGLAWAVRR
jgi:YVTN family beta-propeller protein